MPVSCGGVIEDSANPHLHHWTCFGPVRIKAGPVMSSLMLEPGHNFIMSLVHENMVCIEITQTLLAMCHLNVQVREQSSFN